MALDNAATTLGRSSPAFLPDPSTFQGAVAVGVANGLALALILGVVGWFRHRRLGSTANSPPALRVGVAEAGGSDVADLVTGIRQAMMAVREAIQLFGRAVLVDPDDGSLEENSREVLVEAHRTVDEAEARLPRVELALGDRADEARRAVEELRQALAHLHEYIRQPGSGDDWSMAEHEAAKASLNNAQDHERRFLKKARR